MNEVLSASVVLSEQDFKSCLKNFNINTCLMGCQLLETGLEGPTFVSQSYRQSKIHLPSNTV